jgi:hypothetical protein
MLADRDAIATVGRAGPRESEGSEFGGTNVHIMNGFRAAWFTDPDGNILHVNNM